MIRLCCFLFMVMASLHAGKIMTTDSLDSVYAEFEKLDKNALVLFDVDDTLITPNDAILQCQGRELFAKLTEHYKDRDLFREVRLQAPHSLVDPKTLQLIGKLQKRNVPTIAFTAAPAKIHIPQEPGQWRVDELLKYGFDFSLAFPNCNTLQIPKSPHQSHFPLFKSGVLYASFHPKGDILVTFIKLMKIKPTKVIFVDDIYSYVKSVVKSLEACGIPCIGIHYTAADKLATDDLDRDLAKFQVNYFVNHGIWISDSECKQEYHALAK